MSSDIVLPKDNEAEFIKIAVRLGIRKLCFLYDFDEYDEEKMCKKLDTIKNSKISIEIAFLVNQKNLGKAAKTSKFLAAKSSDKDKISMESKKIKLIYGFEESGRRDYIHQRASGLNHIICELARKNNVAVGFSYGSLINNKNTTQLLGRMIQNLELCRKYKVNSIIASFSSNPFELRAHHDVSSLFKLLGTEIKTNF